MKCDLNLDEVQTLVKYLGVIEPRIDNVIELISYSTEGSWQVGGVQYFN